MRGLSDLTWRVHATVMASGCPPSVLYSPPSPNILRGPGSRSRPRTQSQHAVAHQRSRGFVVHAPARRHCTCALWRSRMMIRRVMPGSQHSVHTSCSTTHTRAACVRRHAGTQARRHAGTQARIRRDPVAASGARRGAIEKRRGRARRLRLKSARPTHRHSTHAHRGQANVHADARVTDAASVSVFVLQRGSAPGAPSPPVQVCADKRAARNSSRRAEVRGELVRGIFQFVDMLILVEVGEGDQRCVCAGTAGRRVCVAGGLCDSPLAAAAAGWGAHAEGARG